MIETLGIVLIFIGIILIFIGMISSGDRISERSVFERESRAYERKKRRTYVSEIPEIHEVPEEINGIYEDYGEHGKYGWKNKEKREVRGAGIIMIGPIPIIFGDSKYAFYLGIIAMILMLLSILIMFSVWI